MRALIARGEAIAEAAARRWRDAVAATLAERLPGAEVTTRDDGVVASGRGLHRRREDAGGWHDWQEAGR